MRSEGLKLDKLDMHYFAYYYILLWQYTLDSGVFQAMH